jgi:ribonuclease D
VSLKNSKLLDDVLTAIFTNSSSVIIGFSFNNDLL